MSTWCAAKSLFLYYRKYLSEHICNRLLWEHIRGNLVHTTHSGGFTFRQQTSRILQVASAHQSCHTPLQKTASAQLPSIFKISTHTAVAFPTACWFCWKGAWLPSYTSAFPYYFPVASRQRYVFLPNLESAECIWGGCLLFSTTPCPSGSPWPFHTQPGILDGYEGPCVTRDFPAAEIIPAEATAMQCPGEMAIPDRYHLLPSDTMSASALRLS